MRQVSGGQGDGRQVIPKTGARRSGHIQVVWIMDVRWTYTQILQGMTRWPDSMSPSGDN